ncbi:phytoene desaturase [Corynebacterium diphtheriae]|uniref:phytoene desaturase n=1 Tax=Corynebacterium diphtheriae TaxID=1717 RepID=UPI0019817B26|nr:phytoene desaturase [Corynebacterium diphtheriae]MBN4651950.1 phytoene desaturase [Corynebacterium diphtheriae bv. mitis]MBN4654263.1 phytoene desaturase [Corynebacterium diphtheriae bv. mitis]
MAKHAIVIGAGVAGLATAGLLAREGYHVRVFEKLDAPGGRAGQLTDSGFRWDTGPSWYLMPEAYDRFFELMGTTTKQAYELVDLHPAYRLFPEGSPALDVDSGVGNVATLFDALDLGAGKKVQRYLRNATDMYHLSLRHFLYTTFSNPRDFLRADILRRLPYLARLLSSSLDTWVRNRFPHPILRQILSYPAVFLSTQPSQAPALYSLMSHTDLVEGVRYPRGGFAAIMSAIEKIDREAGVEFYYEHEVTDITIESGRACGITAAGPHGTSTFNADVVVSAADLHHTETRLLPPHLRSYPENYWSKRNPGLGTVLIMLGVRGHLPELAHHNLLFSKDWDPDFAAVYSGPHPSRPLGASQSIYISKTSATDSDAAPEGHENLFILVPVPANDALGHGNTYHHTASPRVEEITRATIAQIAAWTGISDLDERIVVTKTIGPADFSERYHAWSSGAIGPAHTLRQSAFFRGKNMASKVKGLYYAGGTTVPGVGVPMCLISAENVITRIKAE